HDAIWVVVDRLTKSIHFLPIHKDYSVSRLAEIFQQEIVRLHGTPSVIISDREPRFIEGPEMIEVTNAKVAVAKEKLKEARTRQKSYADKHRRALEFQTGRRLFRLSRFFGGTIPSGKPLGKPKNLSGLLIPSSFHDMYVPSMICMFLP
nr:IPP transferase [Tanacetum cinerariifolium]